MRTIGTLIACLALLSVGCGDSRSDEDAGGIVLMDSGPRADAGPGRDAGPGGSVFPTMCSVTGFMPLPTSCTPRCTNATLGVVNACMDATCFRNALMADTTPPATVTGPGGSSPVNCFDCFAWQVQTCYAELCPTEFEAWAMCMAPADCTAQNSALDACLMTNSAALDTCANPRIEQCFDRSAGFLPDLGPRTHFQVDTERFLDFIERYDRSIF